jgi:two-component system chemotaxis response regulator CheY
VTWSILVVDDSANARLLLRLAFEAKGARVIEAENGREGLRRARSEQVDLIFSDIRMPVMDGLQMIRELRKVPEHEETPIFVLTSDVDAARAEEGKRAGANAWIIKASTPDALWKVVEKALLGRVANSLSE